MKFPLIFSTLFLSLLLSPLSMVVAEENRTAGTQAVSEPASEKSDTAEHAKEKEEEEEGAQKKNPEKKEKIEEVKTEKVKKEPKVYSVSLSSLESLGLYSSQSDGGFGRDLWSESSRENLTPLINNLPETSESYFINSMIMGVLLSTANASLIDDDKNYTLGEDLFTLRLKKLLALGAYEQAFELYSLLDESPYHYELAKTGITAMLLSGNKSLACLDVKTAAKRFEETPLFRGLSAYCDLGSEEDADKKNDMLATLKASSVSVLKKIGRNSKYEQNYNPHLLGELSHLELGLLVADKRLKFMSIETIGLTKIPRKHLALVLAADTLSARQRIALTVRALKYVLVRPSVLKKLYESTEIPEEPSGWIRLAAIYQKAKAAKDENRQIHVESAFKLMNTYGREAFIPFAALIKPTKNTNNLYDNLLILNAAKSPIKNWKDVFEDIPAKKTKTARKERLSSAFAIYISLPKTKQKQSVDDFWMPHIAPAFKIKHPLVDADFFDALQNNTKNNAYGKSFSLTPPKDYVMPSVRLLDRLRNASNRGAISEVILLSTYILRNLEPTGTSGLTIGNIYPGLLRDIIQSLDVVGLKNTSRDLAVLAALEHIK
jgi:hypothetical protein